MANERVYTTRNVGNEEMPRWERWFAITVADAVMMSDKDGETRTIVDFINERMTELIGGAPETFDTLKEIADYIASHQEVADALTEAIGAKADKSVASLESDGLMSKEDKAKLSGIDTGANCYSHPESHPAAMIEEDAVHRFVSDGEKEKWNNIPTIGFGTEPPSSLPANSLFFFIRNS